MVGEFPFRGRRRNRYTSPVKVPVVCRECGARLGMVRFWCWREAVWRFEGARCPGCGRTININPGAVRIRVCGRYVS